MTSLQKACHFLCLGFFFLNFQDNLLSSSSSSSSCSHDEASALIQFKSSFSLADYFIYEYCYYAGIKSYLKTDSWKEGTDCCSWDGVTCDNIKGHVIGLDLSCSRLYGTIPSNSSLFHLPHLQKLNLAFNDFNASKMSSKFGEFASLVYLNLSASNFAGQVPSQVSQLSKLVLLDLSGNYLQTFDKHNLERLIHNLTEVRELFLDETNMSSVNPNILMNLSSSLRSLSLYGCGLRGKFPENIFHLPNLKLLFLGYNQNLNLKLPQFNKSSHLELLDLSAMSFSRKSIEWIGNLQSLKYLNLSATSFSKGLPDLIGNLVSLKDLDLSSANLMGSIPTSLGNLSSSLRSLNLNDCGLQGKFPENIFHLPSLEMLFLGYNVNLSLPKSNWSSPLKLLDISFIPLSKELIDSIRNLASLEHLDVSYTSLADGGLLDSIGNLISLKHLHAEWAQISGAIPKALGNLSKLNHLDLSGNYLSGQISSSLIRNLSQLKYLSLRDNQLEGSMPVELPWKEIEILDLSSNLIHGDLPIPPSKIQVFFISNNSLSGEIPSLVCNLSSLGFLDVSHNKLSGIIPQCFGNLSKSAEILNLRMNKLHGIIPTFVKGCQLRNLNLNGNQLEGPLTRSISNCRSLEVLDLGKNKIKGKFPHWLGGLPRLEVLVLRSNQLQGSIRDKRSTLSFSKIQIFDLSSNYFTGTLPVRYIQNFRSMINLTKTESVNQYLGADAPQSDDFYSYSIGLIMKGEEMELMKIFNMLTSIDLSQNMFEGEIPKVIGMLDSLKGLNLSHNNLSGCIPTSIGNLSSLEWLDLSSNKLIGTIPETLLDVTSLSIFNVSENQLEGQIPRGKQFNTFGIDSYEGNKGLCGFPVSKSCINSKPPPSILLKEEGSESNITFGLKVVLIGYGCGVVFGLAMGYVVFQTGKPKWFVALVEDRHHKRRKPSKIGNQRGGRRRI